MTECNVLRPSLRYVPFRLVLFLGKKYPIKKISNKVGHTHLLVGKMSGGVIFIGNTAIIGECLRIVSTFSPLRYF